MHRSEADQQLVCAACGATVDPGARVYGFAPLAVLCWDCSLARGGRYDAHEERWTRPPSVSDLAEPER